MVPLTGSPQLNRLRFEVTVYGSERNIEKCTSNIQLILGTRRFSVLRLRMNLKLKIGKFIVFVIHSVGSAISNSSMPLENSKELSKFTDNRQESDGSVGDSTAVAEIFFFSVYFLRLLILDENFSG